MKKPIRADLKSLREQMQDQKKDLPTSYEKPLFKEEELNLTVANLTDNEDINKILRKNMYEFINHTAKNRLWYGKHFQELFELLGNGESANQYTSCYTSYLKLVNIDPKTARKYRKRYSFFSQTENENIKKLISIISDEDINYLENNPKFFENLQLEYKDKEITKELFKELKEAAAIDPLEENIEEAEEENNEKDIEVLPAFDINDFSLKIEDIQNKIKKVSTTDNDTFNQVKKYLEKIEKILNKSVEE